MNFRIEILRSAQKDLAKIERTNRSRIVTAIEGLAAHPRPEGCKRLTGRPAWRIRIGTYRVIYEIHDEKLVVLVVTIGHRRDVYK